MNSLPETKTDEVKPACNESYGSVFLFVVGYRNYETLSEM
jgi:hypothetical protein